MKLRLKLLKMSLKYRLGYLVALLKYYLKYPIYLLGIKKASPSHIENMKICKLYATKLIIYANFIEQVNSFYLILSAYRAYARDAMSNPDDYDILHDRFACVKNNIRGYFFLLESMNIHIPVELRSTISTTKVNELVNSDSPYDYLTHLHSLCSKILVI